MRHQNGCEGCFLQNLLPLCHQPSETTVFQTHASGGSKVAGGSKAVVTANDSPNLFTTVKTAFSYVENDVFLRRKRRFPAWQHTHAQQLPSPRGGVGGGALLPPPTLLPPPLLPLCTKGFCGARGRVAAKTEKKLLCMTGAM